MKKIFILLLILASCSPIHLVIDDPAPQLSRAVGWQTMRAKQNFMDSTKFQKQAKFIDGVSIGNDAISGSDVVVLDSVTTDGTNIYFYSGPTILTAVPGVGGAAWGALTGSLPDQIDLATALGLKANANNAGFTGTTTGITAAMVGAMSTSHAANVITATDLSHYASAYGWGNHALAGYALTSALTNYVLTTTTVNGHGLGTNVSVTAADLSLGNVDNTSDANKPISTATATALSGKQATLISTTNIKSVGGISLLGSGDIPVGGTGTVTSVAVTTANGVSASVANPTTAANMTFSLGDIAPTKVNTIVLSGSSTPTLAVTGTTAVSGTNTGDNATNTQYSSLVTNATHLGDATGSGALTIAAGAVTLAKMANMATGSLIYRKSGGAGAPEVNSLATLKTDLGLTNTNSGDQTTITGNAGSATILQTTRKINGIDFNGSTDITVPSNIAAGTIKNVMESNGSVWTSGKPKLNLEDSTVLANGYVTPTQNLLKANTADVAMTYLPVVNPTVAGLLTTSQLIVGDPTSNTKLQIDSIGLVDGKAAIYSGADTIPFHTLATEDIGISTIALMKDDTVDVVATKYDLDILPKVDYVIEKIGSTYYANPLGSYTAYSSANFKTMMDLVMAALTTGGDIYIKPGLYDGLDAAAIKPIYNKISIRGAGRYRTILKLKANADAGVGFDWTGLIDCDVDKFTVEDLELNGNDANQILIDNGTQIGARLMGIRVGQVGSRSDSIFVRNCYVHDFTCNGIQYSFVDDGLIEGCYSKDNGYNNISLGTTCNRVDVLNCRTLGSGDVSISLGGYDTRVINCIVGDCYGTNGSINSTWGIGIEGQTAAVGRNSIINCTITGAHTNPAIAVSTPSYSSSYGLITGNYLHDLTSVGNVALSVTSGSYMTITNNKISTVNGQAMVLQALTFSTVMNNDISGVTGDPGRGIRLTINSTNNRVIGNSVIAHEALSIASGSNNNYIVGNILTGATAAEDFTDAATGTIYRSNYAITSGKWIAETGLISNAVTATSDGLTTGIITQGSQNLTVASNTNDAYIISLPAASATTIGTKITGLLVGSKICELRTQAAQEGTVYINGITGAGKEAALPAACNFEVIQVSASAWILKAWTALGAEITAIIPD